MINFGILSLVTQNPLGQTLRASALRFSITTNRLQNIDERVVSTHSYNPKPMRTLTPGHHNDLTTSFLITSSCLHLLPECWTLPPRVKLLSMRISHQPDSLTSRTIRLDKAEAEVNYVIGNEKPWTETGKVTLVHSPLGRFIAVKRISAHNTVSSRLLTAQSLNRFNLSFLRNISLLVLFLQDKFHFRITRSPNLS